MKKMIVFSVMLLFISLQIFPSDKDPIFGAVAFFGLIVVHQHSYSVGKFLLSHPVDSKLSVEESKKNNEVQCGPSSPVLAAAFIEKKLTNNEVQGVTISDITNSTLLQGPLLAEKLNTFSSMSSDSNQMQRQSPSLVLRAALVHSNNAENIAENELLSHPREKKLLESKQSSKPSKKLTLINPFVVDALSRVGSPVSWGSVTPEPQDLPEQSYIFLKSMSSEKDKN
jgi:hypothetical protein